MWVWLDGIQRAAFGDEATLGGGGSGDLGNTESASVTKTTLEYSTKYLRRSCIGYELPTTCVKSMMHPKLVQPKLVQPKY